MFFAAPRRAVAAERRAEKIPAQRVQQRRQAGVDFLPGPRRDGKRLHRAPARQALDWHSRILSKENLAWLRGLPYTHSIEDVGFSHGSPAHTEDFEYIFATDQVRELSVRLKDFKAVQFIGHSHLCKCFSYDATSAHEVLHTRFRCDPERHYVITAGSVGQPRDYDSRACFGTYDTETRQFEYGRMAYDVESAARKIFEADLAVAFGKRLFLGV